MLSTCTHQKTKSEGSFYLKAIDLPQVKTTSSKDFLLIPLEKSWLNVNDGKPIVFDARLTKNGKLILTGSLSKLVRTNEVDTNEM